MLIPALPLALGKHRVVKGGVWYPLTLMPPYPFHSQKGKNCGKEIILAAKEWISLFFFEQFCILRSHQQRGDILLFPPVPRAAPPSIPVTSLRGNKSCPSPRRCSLNGREISPCFKARGKYSPERRNSPWREERGRNFSLSISLCVLVFLFYFLFVLFLKANLYRLTKVTKDPVISLQLPEKEDFQQKVKSVKSFHFLS